MLGIALAATVAPALSAATWSVAPGGSDAAAGSLAAPFQTLAKAASMAQPGDTVYLRQGVYRETLTAVRSGTATAPIIFSAYAGEEAVLAGCNAVSGAWQPYQGKIWYVDGQAATGDLFVDGQEMPLARWPNVAPGAAMTAGWATAAAGTNASTLVDPQLPALALTGAHVHIIPGLAWVSYSSVAATYGGGQLTFASPIGFNASYYPTAGNRYFLYGALALLDSPGEWFQDPVSQRLYLWSPDGLSPATHQVEIAARKQVALVNGFNDIQFRGLDTFCGGISINNCSGCRVLGVNQRYVQHFTDVSAYGTEASENALNGGSGCEWAGGSISGSSGDGIYASGAGAYIHNMVIHDVCQIATYKAAVTVNGSAPVIEHNTFYDSARFLIYHAGAKGGDIEYNSLYNAGLLTNDLGATYAFRTDGQGMVIAYNLVHDVVPSLGTGIYLDNATSNYVVHHNVVYNCANALVLNLPSNGNMVCNNTLYGKVHWVSACCTSQVQSMTGTTLVNNLSGGGARLLLAGTAAGPTQITNGAYVAPPAIFATGAWTLAAGSPAIDKGTVEIPYTNGYCGAAPDQGAYEYACGSPWVPGASVTPVDFPYPISQPITTATFTTTPARTQSPSPSGTRTLTPSATRTATPSATRTATPSATGTATPSATGTSTPSATGTAMPSATVTSTPSASGTATLSTTWTATPCATATSTPRATCTATRSATGTGTPSPIGTATPSVTSTATLSATRMATPSATATVTLGIRPSETASASPSGSVTPSATTTTSPSASPSPTVTASPTGTLGSAAVSVTPTPNGEPGPLRVLDAAMAPSPYGGQGPLRLVLHLAGPCEKLHLRIYSPALVAAVDLEQGPWPQGWVAWTLPGPLLGRLRPGVWLLAVDAADGSRRSTPFRRSFYVLPR